MVFGAGVEVRRGAVGRDGDEGRDEVTVFLLVSFVRVSVFLRAKFQSRQRLPGHERHREVRVGDAGPLGLAADGFDVGTLFILGDLRGAHTVNVFADVGHSLRRHGIESVFGNPLIADARPDDHPHVGHRLAVLRNPRLDLDGVTVGVEGQFLQDLKPAAGVRPAELDCPLLARLQLQTRVAFALDADNLIVSGQHLVQIAAARDQSQRVLAVADSFGDKLERLKVALRAGDGVKRLPLAVLVLVTLDDPAFGGGTAAVKLDLVERGRNSHLLVRNIVRRGIDRFPLCIRYRPGSFCGGGGGRRRLRVVGVVLLGRWRWEKITPTEENDCGKD